MRETSRKEGKREGMKKGGKEKVCKKAQKEGFGIGGNGAEVK